MWNYEYKLIAIPEAVASHARGLTFERGKRGPLSVYLSVRNKVALSLITNAKYKHIIKHIILLHAIRSTATSTLMTKI